MLSLYYKFREYLKDLRYFKVIKSKLVYVKYKITNKL